MNKPIPDIRFVSIDLDSLDDVEENDQAVQFDIVLNAEPTNEWKQEFEYLYDHNPHAIKPQVATTGSRLHVAYLPRYGAELQEYVDFLTEIAARATAEARLTLQLQTTEQKDRQRQEFREVLRGIRLNAGVD